MASRSFFRRAEVRARELAASEAAHELVEKGQRAAQLKLLDRQQAEVDAINAASLAGLMEQVRALPEARVGVRVGALMAVKFDDGAGPVVLGKVLTHGEMRAMDKFPAVITRPDSAFDNLALAVRQIEGEELS